MKLIELTISNFEKFSANHALKNYCQTANYAKVMGEQGYSYDYIGFVDETDNIIAASLILIKKINTFSKYAYAPKGFLIDYYNEELLKNFLNEIKKHYKNKGVIFIKINPEIMIGQLNQSKNFSTSYNNNVKLIDNLKELGFKRRRELKPLEFIFPKINAYIPLKNFKIDKLKPETKKMLDKYVEYGLSIEIAQSKEINQLYDFIKENINTSIDYFRNLINIFNNANEPNVDLLFLKIDYEKCLVKTQEEYNKELNHNNECNEKIQENNSEDNLNEKMESDRNLLKIKNDIIEATEGLKKNKFKYIAGAILVKYQNRISIIASGKDKNFEKFNPELYLYYGIIEKYKNQFEYLDLNGLASDYNESSPYYHFNEQKLKLNPSIYEYIGEFDFIIDELKFKKIQGTGFMSEEFKPQYKIKEDQ